MGTTTKAILAFIKRYIAQKGFSPSFRDIRDGVGLGSVSAVEPHIKTLEAQGYITRVKGQARTIRITEAASENPVLLRL